VTGKEYQAILDAITTLRERASEHKRMEEKERNHSMGTEDGRRRVSYLGGAVAGLLEAARLVEDTLRKLNR